MLADWRKRDAERRRKSLQGDWAEEGTKVRRPFRRRSPRKFCEKSRFDRMESSSLSSESGSQPVLCSSCFFRNNVLLSPRAPPTGDYPQTSPSRKFSDDKRAVREAYGFRFRLRFVVCRLVEIFLPYEASPPDQFTWNTTKEIGRGRMVDERVCARV